MFKYLRSVGRVRGIGLPKEPTPVELSWLAGLIDGDGCICLTVSERTDAKTLRIYPRVIIAMAHDKAWIEPVTDILGRLGATYYTRTYIPPDKRAAQTAVTVTRKKHVQTVIDAIRPYTVLKKEQVRLMGKYLKMKYSWPGDIRPVLDVLDELRSYNQTSCHIKWSRKKVLDHWHEYHRRRGKPKD